MAKLSSVILRNKGVPVDVYVLTPTEDGALARTISDEGNLRTEQRWVRMDANCIAEIEDYYDSLEGFEKASMKAPFKAIRQALAICWEVTPKQAGLMMVDGHLNAYTTAVGVALSVANGVDPTNAVELLEMGLQDASKAQVTSNKVMKQQIAEAKKAKLEDDSPGTSGRDSGAKPEKSSTTSGDTVQLRSAS